jgi:hypothetical protein
MTQAIATDRLTAPRPGGKELPAHGGQDTSTSCAPIHWGRPRQGALTSNADRLPGSTVRRLAETQDPSLRQETWSYAVDRKRTLGSPRL